MQKISTILILLFALLFSTNVYAQDSNNHDRINEDPALFADTFYGIAKLHRKSCDDLAHQLSNHIDKYGDQFFENLANALKRNSKEENDVLLAKIFRSDFLALIHENCKDDETITILLDNYFGRLKQITVAYLTQSIEANAREALVGIKILERAIHQVIGTDSCTKKAETLKQLLKMQKGQFIESFEFLNEYIALGHDSLVVKEYVSIMAQIMNENGDFMRDARKCATSSQFILAFTKFISLLQKYFPNSEIKEQSKEPNTEELFNILKEMQTFFQGIIDIANKHNNNCDEMASDLNSYLEANKDRYAKLASLLIQNPELEVERVHEALVKNLSHLENLLKACENSKEFSIFAEKLIILLESSSKNERSAILDENLVIYEFAVEKLINYFNELNNITIQNKNNCAQLGEKLAEHQKNHPNVLFDGLYAYLKLPRDHYHVKAFSVLLNSTMGDDAEVFKIFLKCEDDNNVYSYFSDFMTTLEAVAEIP